MSLQLFHKAVAGWFANNFKQPTAVQVKAWRAIKSKDHTLIAAPTGSGKTLAAFLSAIDDLVRQGINGKLRPGVQVVYISPLKALSNDIEKNLQKPLREIQKALPDLGLPEVYIEAMVRTGDTTASARSNMIKNPPHILVTTPESLYLLLTSENGRKMLSGVHTLILDEIHALVGDKRGSHLSLSVERLEGIVSRPLHRIGLSATQKPVEQVARFLTGVSSGKDIPCAIIDTGHSRKLDLSLEVPQSPLTAVMANEVWTEIYDKLIGLIESHQTTLIFVNTRRLAERLTHNLNERLGPGFVLAHHGSMSKERRFDAESRLKSGALRALVATASMELGIDVGSIDLVCQIGSPRSISAFLQRVGRSGHSVDKTPRGRLFPLTLDELVECTAIMDAVARGELDRIVMPEKPLDVLAQQIVAETACQEYAEQDLFKLVKSAYPYRNLTKKEYEETLAMLSEGFTSRRGRRAAYIYRDAINERVKARKGARLTALISGGAIPDNFEYDVVLEPENIFLGTVNEDFAVESIPGDIFQLGNNSWKILKIETGKVRVEDAAGQPPNIPFWIAEAPGRTRELSYAVSRLREETGQKLGEMDPVRLHTGEWKEDVVNWLIKEKNSIPEAAGQLAEYLASAKAALKTMPTQQNIVMERFFDEAGDMHLVIHSPFGSRMNKAWGLALRKRFCRKFNFELQAAASEDAIILSLGPTHSFPLEEVFGYLNPETVRDVLIQAMLDAPVFEVRWRWNASRALAIIRRRANRKVPAQLQRMQSEDLIAQVFPDQLACLENIAGDRQMPDHPLVNQTIHDCLYEAMDIEALEELLRKIRNKEIGLVALDLKEASPLAHEIIHARPYAFLDDAPLEERRTLAVRNRRWMTPEEASEIGRLDPLAIEQVREEAWPEVSNPDELHDALLLSGFLTRSEGLEKGWQGFFDELIKNKRAAILHADDRRVLWIAAERIPFFKEIYGYRSIQPDIVLPEKLQAIPKDADPMTEIVRGRLEIMGPVTAGSLAGIAALPIDKINHALYNLENEGFVFRGSFTGINELEWCERRLLSRIHRYTIQKLRSEIRPVSSAEFMRFLFSWHQLDPDGKGSGPAALERAIKKLEGFEAPAVSWEGEILTARIADYDRQWLDMLCGSGKITWGRFRTAVNGDKQPVNPIRTTPISLIGRNDLNIWLNRNPGSGDGMKLSSRAGQVLEALRIRGACFFDDILDYTRLFPSQAEEAMGELIGAGLISSDSFTGLRALLVSNKYKTNGRRGKAEMFSMNYAGRWFLLEKETARSPAAELLTDRLESISWALLRRYGVIFRKLAERETLAPAWRDLVRMYRTLEARGQIRGGRFIDGVWGEQFALPEAIVELRRVKKEGDKNTLISISAADPLNLTGIVTPGQRIPAYTNNRILYRDGCPLAAKEASGVKFFSEPEEENKWAFQNALIKRAGTSPELRKYLGA